MSTDDHKAHWYPGGRVAVVAASVAAAKIWGLADLELFDGEIDPDRIPDEVVEAYVFEFNHNRKAKVVVRDLRERDGRGGFESRRSVRAPSMHRMESVELIELGEAQIPGTIPIFVVAKLDGALEVTEFTPNEDVTYVYPSPPPHESEKGTAISDVTFSESQSLNGRVHQQLRRHGVKTVEKLITFTAGEIDSWRNCGPKVVKAIEETLAARDLSLKQE